MALGFQDPGLLWFAAAAAAVPVVAHLVARTRPPEMTFPTVEFLRPAMRRVWRMRKPQDILLLILRTLAVTTLAAAFARPLWMAGENWAGISEVKNLVLLVDRTGSMAAASGGQTRFSKAKARAVEALRGAGRLESVNLVWMDSVPDAVYPRMGRVTAPIEAALEEAVVTGEAGEASAAVRLALEKLAEVEGTKELIVISDFQKGSWGGVLTEVPSSIRLVTLPVDGETANLSITGLEVMPLTPLPGETIEILGRIGNHSAERRTVKVAVTVGTMRQVRELEIDPWGEGQVAVEAVAPDGEAEFLIRASLEGADDVLPADDARWIVGRGREALRVGFAFAPDSVSDAEREVWSRIVRSFSWTREVSNVSEAEILIMADASEASVKAATAVLAKGGGVIFRPTRFGGNAGGWFNTVLGEGGRWESKSDGEAGWGMRLARQDDALYRLFASGEYGNPAGGRTLDRWQTAGIGAGGNIPEGWELLMVYDDSVPALWRTRRDRGTLWWWNLAPDPSRSTWPRQSAFLPFLGEALLQSRPPQVSPAHLSGFPGQPARWEPILFPEGGSVVLLDAGGEITPLAEDSASGSLAYRSAQALQTGAYRWAMRDPELDRDVVLAYTAVNFPESEMDGRAIDADALAQWSRATSGTGPGVRPDWSALREGKPLWHWFLIAAFICFGMEALILFFGMQTKSFTPERGV